MQSVPGLLRYFRSSPRSVHLPDGQSLVCHLSIYGGFAPSRKGQVLQERDAYIVGYHALQRFCPEIEPRALGIEILHPHGVASSWRCIRRLYLIPSTLALRVCAPFSSARSPSFAL